MARPATIGAASTNNRITVAAVNALRGPRRRAPAAATVVAMAAESRPIATDAYTT